MALGFGIAWEVDRNGAALAFSVGFRILAVVSMGGVTTMVFVLVSITVLFGAVGFAAFIVTGAGAAVTGVDCASRVEAGPGGLFFFAAGVDAASPVKAGQLFFLAAGALFNLDGAFGVFLAVVVLVLVAVVFGTTTASLFGDSSSSLSGSWKL
jgi:hypothetical protein